MIKLNPANKTNFSHLCEVNVIKEGSETSPSKYFLCHGLSSEPLPEKILSYLGASNEGVTIEELVEHDKNHPYFVLRHVNKNTKQYMEQKAELMRQKFAEVTKDCHPKDNEKMWSLIRSNPFLKHDLDALVEKLQDVKI